MTGEVVGQIVLRLLKKFGLPLNPCVGIGTDGCSMISEVRGAVSEIQKEAKNALKTPCYNLSVLCLSDILALSLPLSKLFQKPDLDLDAAAELICCLKTILSTRRENSEDYFTKIWAKAEELAEEEDAHLIPPRRCGRQKNRANYETEDANTYFRQAIYLQLNVHFRFHGG
ncbi:hypothetical protein JTE90_024714 [Oedothorax gibbosus]|uniref:Uncharacterized protein n=1 Tax=Oedothorax gibbosus TaxID=931172 RepID=A0AAV6UBV2_9ARAC|nr:hypothetical protein JTE90_024714 [Oedothorax gibbosus]